MHYNFLRKRMHKVILLSFLIVPTISNAQTLSVQVKETYLREKPSFLSKQKAKLSYAQQVYSQREKNSWHFIKTIKGDSQGWVHNSALSKEVIALQSSDKLANTSVSQNEIIMAGKGFNKSVEDAYKKDNKNLDYETVDAIEKAKPINTTTLIHFAKNGKLNL